MATKALIFVLIYFFISFGVIFISERIFSYFLFFKLEKHPKIIEFIFKKLDEICKKEKIFVYDYSYNELNKDIENFVDLILGRYIYTYDNEYQEKINEYIDIINKLSKNDEEYKDYSKTNKNFKSLVLPRIEICNAYDNERIKLGGMISYFITYLHELGHHFAFKNMGKHTERDADYYAYQIIKNEFPMFFRLIYDFRFKNEKMSIKEKIVGMFQFLKYLITKKIEYGNL